jgi:hydrogenase maturation protein HypF
VQGVGFRPYVFTLSADLGLAGFVRNDERGVVLEVEGPAAAVERFLVRLPAEAPPLSCVEAVRTEELAPTGERGFAIAPSAGGGSPDAPVSPDTATCDDCLRELFDPSDRRFRYPFTNCTNCGPRFTIVRGVPYDRPRTTMAGFAMCALCRAEYEDPHDRRFHAQPIACPTCGPVARLVDAEGNDVSPSVTDAAAAAAAALLAGRIVAIKGLGGFHLACRAGDEAAVAALRARKHREDRPFALMVRDLATAHALAALGPEHEALLVSRARPIVLAPRRPDARVAPSVAPAVPELGLMLPYAPLHHLLLADAGEPLVMTSGNVSDEPIAFRDEDARERLRGIADLFLVHERPIETRTDDSVVRVVRGRPLMLRRSRGHVPAALPLPLSARPVLGCGAELKNTFCLARGRRAWVGHHIGDLANPETLQAFADGIEHVGRLFDVRPQVVAHDLHPGYLSTAYALEREGVELVGIQHHHAHLAACLAEHGERGPAVGAIFDGTGYGPDGTVWGGELLVGGLDGVERAGHLHPVRMPGGEQAIHQPWRMACAWLAACEDGPDGTPRSGGWARAGAPAPVMPAGLAARIDPSRWEAVARLASTGLSSPVTTSMGRLFDAVAALCGVRQEVTYEGQAAIELEAAADPREPGAYAFALGGDPLVLDARPVIRAVAADVHDGAPAGVVAARFHAGLASATADACAQVAARAGLDTVVLSGGTFQNALLLTRTAAALEARALRVLVPERLPPNDGGISFGQVAIAAARG